MSHAAVTRKREKEFGLQENSSSQHSVDLYAAQSRPDVAYRLEWCERAGLGFELGELSHKSGVPIRPYLVA